MLNRIYRIITRINNATVSIAAIFVLLMAILVTYEVLMRYIFNAPSTWAPEISTYVLLFIAFLGGAYTLQVDSHISCDVFVYRLKPRIRRLFFLASAPFGLVYCLILGWQVWNLFFRTYTGNEVSLSVLAIPMKYPTLIMPIGVLLLVITYLFKIRQVLLKPPEQLSNQSEVD